MTRKKGKTATVGMKIAKTIYVEGTVTDAIQRVTLARRIDAAVRRAVKEAWYSDKNMDREHIERKYNIKL